MSSVRLEGICNSYGDVAVLKQIDLTVEAGNFVTLLGASGSGKTTCLRIVAGFVKPSSGRVFIGEEDVTAAPAYRRDTGMVFQHYALFPHMTVAQNVSYGLRVRRLPRADIASRTSEILRLVQMEDFAGRYPKQLSGGQKQRVALARAVVVRPKVLLLDEPLGALDLKLREELQVEIRRVQQTLGITTVSVTHDQSEALSMSDRVVVMRNGHILQVDTPLGLYQRPNSVYVARFVGRMNLVRARIVTRDASATRHTVMRISGAAETIAVVGPQIGAFRPDEMCFVAFRPEDATLDGGQLNGIAALAEKTTYQGDGWTVTCRIPDGESIAVRQRPDALVPEPGAAVTVGWSPARCLLLKDDEPGDDAR